ncbi:MAG: hypothetical protein P4L79_14210 [Legionella sp.]|uniref:hypothetical protein n=1 Tax=Legionella sp. TaxID=459 RepID=UPI0028476123|nr:hypothetical protein [Legionella sp.]
MSPLLELIDKLTQFTNTPNISEIIADLQQVDGQEANLKQLVQQLRLKLPPIASQTQELRVKDVITDLVEIDKQETNFGPFIEQFRIKLPALKSQMQGPGVVELIAEFKEIDIQEMSFQSFIEQLRIKLSPLASQTQETSVTQNGINLADCAYECLLELAKRFPLNYEDPILLINIDDNDKLFISTGHQFSFNSLITYHETRSYRGSALKESPEKKYLLNPITNLEFSPRDLTHIKATAGQKRMPIPYLKEKSPTAQSPDRVESSSSELVIPSGEPGSSLIYHLASSDAGRQLLQQLINNHNPIALNLGHSFFGAQRSGQHRDANSSPPENDHGPAI